MSGARPIVPSTADLCDRHGDELGSCETRFEQYGGRRAFRGAAVTIQVDDDNMLVKAAVAEPGVGRVLVVDAGGSRRTALLGDNMAEQAMANAWEGIIIHGAVRDVDRLRSLDIGIKAVGSNPRRSLKNGTGHRDVVLRFGGATFHPGDDVVSDADGVVVLTQQSG